MPQLIVKTDKVYQNKQKVNYAYFPGKTSKRLWCTIKQEVNNA